MPRAECIRKKKHLFAQEKLSKSKIYDNFGKKIFATHMAEKRLRD